VSPAVAVFPALVSVFQGCVSVPGLLSFPFFATKYICEASKVCNDSVGRIAIVRNSIITKYPIFFRKCE